MAGHLKTLALIPSKQLTAAKTRLSSALDEQAREQLSLRMLRHVIEQARLVAGVSACAVLSSDDRALSLAVELGARRIPEQAGSLNRALDLGREWALGAGAEALLVVLSDLPLVRSQDLTELRDSDADVVIAPSTDGGTNALLLRPAEAIPFRFGRDSARYHRFEADKRGLRVAFVETDSIRLDVDTPEDLAAYQALSGPPALVQR